jgi:hypothetical protein
MDEFEKEIITVEELNEYISKLLYNKQIAPHNAEMFNKTFMNMKINEKVVWCLNANFKTSCQQPYCQNILLTNNGKIVIISWGTCHYNTNGIIVPREDYNYVNHDFWIPSECIYIIKTLFKNISGWHRQYESDNRVNSTDISTIFHNLNEYLKHLKNENLINLLDEKEEFNLNFKYTKKV